MTIQEIRKWELQHKVKVPALKKYMRKQKVQNRLDEQKGIFNWDLIEVQMDDTLLQAKEALNNILKKI